MDPVTPPAEPVELAAPTPVDAPPEPVAPEELLFRARERGRHGDYTGARILCEEALAVPGDHQREARYVRAFALEFEGSLGPALAEWDALAAEGRDHDVTFRRAETLGKLGRFREARDELERLPSLGALDPADVTKVEALRWTWTLEDGNPKKALKKLRALVDAPPSTEATWHLGLARLALLRTATDGANAIGFEGSDRARKAAITERAALMGAAEDELAGLILLREPRLALDGFVAVTGCYRDLGEALRDEPAPLGLTERQVEVYRDAMSAKVVQVWLKSVRYADKGLEYAAREDWTGDPLPALAAARAAAEALVEATAPPPPPPEPNPVQEYLESAETAVQPEPAPTP